MDKIITKPCEGKHCYFQIVPGTGTVEGIPTWKCKFCDRQVKAS